MLLFLEVNDHMTSMIAKVVISSSSVNSRLRLTFREYTTSFVKFGQGFWLKLSDIHTGTLESNAKTSYIPNRKDQLNAVTRIFSFRCPAVYNIPGSPSRE